MPLLHIQEARGKVYFRCPSPEWSGDNLWAALWIIRKSNHSPGTWDLSTSLNKAGDYAANYHLTYKYIRAVQISCLFNLNNTIRLIDFNILFAGKTFIEIKPQVSSKYRDWETSKKHLALLDIFLEPSDGQLTTAGLSFVWWQFSRQNSETPAIPANCPLPKNR